MGLSDPVWFAIIGVVGLIVKEYFDMKREERANIKSKAAFEQMDEVKAEMTEVKTNTNHLSQVAIEGGFLKGEKSGIQQERDRADAVNSQIPEAKMQVDHIDVETMTVAKTEKKQP